MNNTRRLNNWVTALTCIALTTVSPIRADEVRRDSSQQSLRQFQATDVRLSQQGEFSGQVVDSQGRPVADAEVQLWTQARLAARCTTKPSGQFRFAGVRAGVYQVLVTGSGSIVRLWQPAAAPPAARNALLLVQGPVVRGQYPPRHPGPHSGLYDGAVMKTLSNPWVFSGLIAAGIAVPLALSNNDEADREGS